MKPQHWIPVVVFLAVSIPLVLLLSSMGVGSELRLILAVGGGVLATAFAQGQLKKKQASENEQ